MIRNFLRNSGDWAEQPYDKEWYKGCEWKHLKTETLFHIDPHWQGRGMHMSYSYGVYQNLVTLATIYDSTVDEIEARIMRDA